MQRTSLRNIIFIALLTAGAVLLNAIDMLVTMPFPYVRLGIAHVMTIVALMLYGVRAAGLVIILKLLITALLFGKLGSPGLSIAIGGNIGAFVFLLFGKNTFSVVPLSIGAAFFNNLSQAAVVFIFFVPHLEILWLFAILQGVGIVTGTIMGVTSKLLIERLEHGKHND